MEREALKKEKDAISKERLNEVKAEIGIMKSDLNQQTSIWEKEKLRINDIQTLKGKIDELNSQAEQVQREGDYQTSAKIRYSDIPEMEKQIESLNKFTENQFIRQEVETEDIADIVAKWTNIPVIKIVSGEQEKLLNLEEQLKKRVVGQDEAVSRVSDVIRMSKMGVTDQNRPIGSFLFFGNTGIGKTELAKSLAEVLFDDEIYHF